MGMKKKTDVRDERKLYRLLRSDRQRNLNEITNVYNGQTLNTVSSLTVCRPFSLKAPCYKEVYNFGHNSWEKKTFLSLDGA